MCGTITSAVSVGASGTSGNLITVQWESNASVQVCSTTGAVTIPGRSFVLLDLGGVSNAITCPNNGTGLSTQVNAGGITDGGTAGTFSTGSGYNHVEIRNGTIGPLYIHTGTASDGIDSVGIQVDEQNGGGNNRWHNLTFSNTAFAIKDGLIGTTSGIQADHNSFVHVGTGMWHAAEGNPSQSDTGFKFNDNDYTVDTGWATAADAIHQEMIHVFPNGSSSTISSCSIYNNHGHGIFPSIGGTAYIFVEQASNNDGSVANCTVFNNLLVLDSGSAIPGDGLIFGQFHNITLQIYNNTIDCNNATNSIGMELDGNTGNSFTFKNNIIQNCVTMIYDPSSGGTWAADFNDYFNGSGWYWAGVHQNTLANWRTASGLDASAITSNPGLNSDYTITSTGSASFQSGTNLISLSITALNTGAPATFGASGSCGAGCITRSASAAWDLGLFPLKSSTLAPPTNIQIIEKPGHLE